jgi:putative transposase
MIAYIDENKDEFGVEPICEELPIAPSTYYAARDREPSARALSDARMLVEIRRVHAANYGVYGARKVHAELVREGFTVARCTVERLMRKDGLKGVLRDKSPRTTRPGPETDRPGDLVERKFTATCPDRLWVADITYIRTHEGWLYLAVVLDLFSRQVIGWSMGSRIDSDLALSALLMAIWRRQPKESVLVHSDQGCQFTGQDWQKLLRAHNLVSSMSRRGNCHDNAVAESFFQLLKRERIRRQIYSTRQDARADVFNYIEMFYNPKRRHNTCGAVSPMEFEKRHYQRLASV